MAESGKKVSPFLFGKQKLFSPVFSSEIENLGSFIPEKSGIRVERRKPGVYPFFDGVSAPHSCK